MFTELFITVYSVVVQVGGQAELCLGCEDAQRPAIEQGDELQGWAILTFKAGIMEKQGEETWAVQISKKKHWKESWVLFLALSKTERWFMQSALLAVVLHVLSMYTSLSNPALAPFPGISANPFCLCESLVVSHASFKELDIGNYYFLPFLFYYYFIES